jgi:hypothetical protein
MVKFILGALFVALTTGIHAGNRWHVNFTPGLSYVPPSPLTILQDRHNPLRLWANYESKPLRIPPYYSYRIGFQNGGRGWELEMNHLKVYLKNLPEEVERFSISHGYNQILANRIYRKGNLNFKAGVGFVAAHPENTVRNLTLDEKKGLFNDGYYITGPVIQYGLFKEIPLGKYFYVLGEARISVAYAKVPVVNGKAHAPVVALHLQVGPGFGID